MNELVSDGFRKGTLRRLYKDPMTNGDFEVLGLNNVLVGVRSKSTDVPLKMGNFPPGLECFEEATSYQDWVFISVQTNRLRQPGKKVKSAQGGKKVKLTPPISPCNFIDQLKVIKKKVIVKELTPNYSGVNGFRNL